MKRHSFLIAALAIAALPAGCPGEGAIKLSGNTGADKVLAVDAGTATEALAAGTTLKASQRASSGWTKDYVHETAALTGDTTASIRRNDDGGVDLIVGDRIIVFTADDLLDGGFQLPDGSAGIFSMNYNSIVEALDEDNGEHSLGFDYYFNDEDGAGGRNSFAVIGTETADSDIETLPTATYSGYAYLRVGPREDFTSFGDVVLDAKGDLSMTANFGAGTVSGEVTDMERKFPSNVDPTRTWTPFTGALTLQTADIDGNGFTGAITSDAGFNANFGTVNSGSTYSGTFFGPNAEQVGGGINGTGMSVDGTPWIGIGLFQGYLPPS